MTVDKKSGQNHLLANSWTVKTPKATIHPTIQRRGNNQIII